MHTIPTLDISNLESKDTIKREQVINKLCSAFHEIGFVAISGHKIPSALLNAMRAQVIELFARPLDEKLSLKVKKDNYRGYVPCGFFSPNRAGESEHDGDYYEAYKLHYDVESSDPIRQNCSLYGPNIWPKESLNLQATVQNYWLECERLTKSLLGAVSSFLGLQETLFKQVFEYPLSNMTLLHYPPSRSANPKLGIHPHKDTDVLTILAPEPVGGLFVRRRESQKWIAANAPEDALIVNVGDMLEIWSDGYFVSTPHKVENASEFDRYSFPYFAVPRHDVLIEPLLFEKDSLPLKYLNSNHERRSMHCGEVSRKIWQSNWPESVAIDRIYDPFMS